MINRMVSDYYRNRAKKRIVVAAIIIALIGAGFWYFSHLVSRAQINVLENSAVKVAADQIVTDVSNPPPLVATGTAVSVSQTGQYNLTRAGVIAQTNMQREENGNLSALAENSQLDAIATLRLQDMFAKQYFAHVSPASSSAVTVAAMVGYQYIALGENLALGDFNGDSGVVTAWMGSPGHRANILDAHYTEIGVGVAEGIFNGQATWIAVQIFGRPASDCPSPNQDLQATISTTQSQLSAILATIQSQKANLATMQQNNDPGYNQAVTSYNMLVGQYNALLAQEKVDVTQYNDEVGAYNQCLQE